MILRFKVRVKKLRVKKRKAPINFKSLSIQVSSTMMILKDILTFLLKNLNNNRPSLKGKYYSCPQRRNFRVLVLGKLAIFYSLTIHLKKR
jgi:hypothetical protein